MSSDNGNKSDVTFNRDAYRTITAREMIAVMQGTDIQALAELFARVVAACPAEWGAADDPDTYLDLSYEDQFVPTLQAFGTDIKNSRKR